MTRSPTESSARGARRSGEAAFIRALVSDGRGKVQLDAHRAAPQPIAGEAIIRPSLCGISHADLAIARGLAPFAGVLGQEFVGVVESVLGRDGALLVGQRVIASPHVVCGKCDMCQGGLRTHCRERKTIGWNGRDGVLADLIQLPIANLIEVPDSMDDDHAVMVHVTAAAIQALRQLHIEGKPYITVLGDNAFGLLCVQVMSKLNASVRLIGWSASILAMAEKWGIKHRLAGDIGRRADQDIVVDCTGTVEGMTLAMQLVRPRGKIVLKAIPHPAAGSLLDLSPLILNELELIGSRCGPLPEALTMIERREVDVVSLISRRVRLADAVNALSLAAKLDVIKVLVEI